MYQFILGLILGAIIATVSVEHAYSKQPCNPNVDDSCPIENVF